MGARLTRIAAAALLAAGAAAAGLLAADVHAWRSSLGAGDRAYATTPSRAEWQPDTRLGGAAESLLGTADDLASRHALQLYVDASKLRLRLDNALEVEGARARAQDALEPLARGRGRSASQALTLLGILAFRSSASGGAQSQVDAALSDFTDAVRLDPANEDAAFDLELLLRLTAAHGSRVENGEGGGFGQAGRHGATGGRSGSGY
jgi:tetratricopeptide (TPR) repeat protein